MLTVSIFSLKRNSYNISKENFETSLNDIKQSKKIYGVLPKSLLVRFMMVITLLSIPVAGYSIDQIWGNTATTTQGVFNSSTSTEIFAGQTKAGNNFGDKDHTTATGVVPIEDAFLALFFGIATYGAYCYRRRREHR